MPDSQLKNGKLESWKEIASYFNRDVRTVIRWEKKRNLPVHRLPGGQAVFAYKTELDNWIQQKEDWVATERLAETAGPVVTVQSLRSPDRQDKGRHFKHNQAFLFGMVALALVAVITIPIIRSGSASTGSALVARIRFTGNAIRAYDDTDHLLWIHVFPKPVHPEVLKHPELTENLIRIADLYGNGGWEALVTVPLEQDADPHTISLTEIDCFSNNGKLLWSYIPHEKFRFGSFDAEGPWLVEDVFVSVGQKLAIWAAMTNGWGNSFVVQLDSFTGKATVHFVNTGIIYKLNEAMISGKRYLLVGGFNNEYAAGILAAMDESKAYAVSPQTAGTRHKCVSCGEGSPDYYFVFPRSEINQFYKAWEDSLRFINVHGNLIEVGKSALGDAALGADRDANKVYVFYDFQTVPDLRPAAFRFDSWYDMMHRELRNKGALDHDINSCPERLHPDPVRSWRPNKGWVEIPLDPAT